MSDAVTKPDEDEAEAQATASKRDPAVTEALAQLTASREGMTEALDELSAATQSALDVPAKIRRNPIKTAALAGGAGFLMLGGPRRVARLMARQGRPATRDPHEGLLPDEIEQVLRDTGVADDPEIRRALDKDFAEYLEKKGRYGPTPGPATSFWRTFDRVAGPLGTVGARIMVQRLVEAEQTRASARVEARKRRIKSR
ncbi:MAG: hypothetical protein ACC726_04180 [Chloroflexota bacterium]